MNYSVFKVEDFVLDEAFIRWVKHHENPIFWNNFLIENPDQKDVVKTASLIVKATYKKEDDINTDEELIEVWEKIQAGIPHSKKLSLKWIIGSGLAAAVLLFAAIQIYFKPVSNSVSYETLIAQVKFDTYKEIVNNGPEPLFVNLPDRSSIVLYKGGKIAYSEEKYNVNKREVYLSGEAFFEVTKNPNKPFFVFSNELITKVLGTSFTIKALENSDRVEVIVKTGKVKVTTQNDASKYQILESKTIEGDFLERDQTINLERSTLTLSPIFKHEVKELKHAIQQMKFNFEDVSFPLVIKDLELAYNIKIVYDRKKWENVNVTAHLSDEPLYDKIDMICKAIDAEYFIKPNEIVIK